MLVKKIKYKDFFGNEREDEFYFNMTEAEVIEWLTTNTSATLGDVLDTMRKKSDINGLLNSVKDLIYRAYGERSVDGRRFIKTEEVKREFMETNAYSVLFMELATDAKASADFINAVIPAELFERASKLQADQAAAAPQEQ